MLFISNGEKIPSNVNVVVGGQIENTSFSLDRRILKKIYIGYLKVRLKTCDNVKSVIE